MRYKIILFVFIACINIAGAQSKAIVLKGATIIDVTNYGNTTNDITDAIVIIKDGKIVAVGKSTDIKIPKECRVIDVKGKYLIPGLIDGFSVLNSQGQANAHLYMGVTTIACSVDRDERRGPLYFGANPSPQVKKVLAIPDDEWNEVLEAQKGLTEKDIQKIDSKIAALDSLVKVGISTVFIHHQFPPQLLDKLMAQARKHHISTIGEPDITPYSKALSAGVNTFVHTSRYILGGMPESIQQATNRDPNDPATLKQFMEFISDFSIESDQGYLNYAKRLSTSRTTLMPTLSLIYSSLSDHKNLWKEPAAVCIDPKEIWLPMDPETGKSTSFLKENYALRMIEIEKGFAKNGVHYLTGSGADAFGAMPGLSEHIEISMLHTIGLTPRQAIAAATNNFSIFMGWNDIGLVEKGRIANLLVLNENPLNDLDALQKIHVLMLNGDIIDRANLLKR